MDTVIVVALISGWVTIIGGLIDLRGRTNGTGPLAKKMDELRIDISELKLEVFDVKQDVRCVKTDLQDHIRNMED